MKLMSGRIFAHPKSAHGVCCNCSKCTSQMTVQAAECCWFAFPNIQHPDVDVAQGVPRSVLQLVADSCIFLASKQEEVAHPTVEELVDISANCFLVGAW